MSLIIDISVKGESSSRRFVLEQDQEIIVGRSNATLELGKDQRLSRKHFVIRHSHGQIEIDHLSKINPTLMAVEGSSRFETVKGTRTEMCNCRIIAGSHRFILTLEQPETTQLSSIPDVVECWSDVDGLEDEDEPEVQLSKPRIDNPVSSGGPGQFSWNDSEDADQETNVGRASETLRQPKSEIPKPQIETGVDSGPNWSESPTIEQGSKNNDSDSVSQPAPEKPKQPEKPPTPKKIIFPIADNFFDD